MSFLSDLFGSINFELIAQLTMLAMICHCWSDSGPFLLFFARRRFVNFALQFPLGFQVETEHECPLGAQQLGCKPFGSFFEKLSKVFFGCF